MEEDDVVRIKEEPDKPREQNDGPKLFAYVAVFGFLFAALYYLVIYLNFYPTAIPTSGTVLSASKSSHRHGYYWKLWVQFDTFEQKNAQTIVTDDESNPNAYAQNDSVSFYYNPKNISETRIDPPQGIVMHSVVFLLLGLYILYSLQGMGKKAKSK